MTNIHRLLIVILVAALVVISGCTEKTGDVPSGMKSQNNNMENNMGQGGMPTAQNQGFKESKEAVINGDFQEVDLNINASGYYPNVIIAKKDIPLRINVYMQDESHASTIVFPDFGINKHFFPGSMGLIQILPTQEGTYKFRCPSDMVRGELIIK